MIEYINNINGLNLFLGTINGGRYPTLRNAILSCIINNKKTLVFTDNLKDYAVNNDIRAMFNCLNDPIFDPSIKPEIIISNKESDLFIKSKEFDVVILDTSEVKVSDHSQLKKISDVTGTIFILGMLASRENIKEKIVPDEVNPELFNNITFIKKHVDNQLISFEYTDYHTNESYRMAYANDSSSLLIKI